VVAGDHAAPDHDVVAERHPAGENPAAGLVHEAVAEGHAEDLGLRAEVEHPVGSVAVEDRAPGIRAHQDQRVGDVQVAGGALVLAGAGPGEGVDPGRQLDHVGAGSLVGRDDRLAERAVVGAAVAVEGVGGLGDGEDGGAGRHCGRGERQQDRKGEAAGGLAHNSLLSEQTTGAKI
jgi:hypothetical protein